MKISSLQSARYEYSPKLPGMLRHGIANIGVQEEPGQQDFDDKQLNNITNTDLFTVVTDQQGQYSHHYDREDKMQDAVHSCSKYEAG